MFARIKNLCRDAVARVLYSTGLLGVVHHVAEGHSLVAVPRGGFRRLQRDSASKFAILCYHRVGETGVPIFSKLKPEVFSAQMRYLKSRYRIVPLGCLCREVQEGRSVKPTIAITFDDGYRDLYSFAYPVLQKYRIPATIYLIGHSMETGEAPWYDRIFATLSATSGPIFEIELESPRRFIFSSAKARIAAAWEIVCYLRGISDERRRAWCSSLERRVKVPHAELLERMLNWQQVREMHRAGVEFGAHTMTHPAVSRLDASALPEELARPKRLLEGGLDAPIQDFAYPFGKPGDLSGAAEKFLKKSEYRSAVTTIGGYNKPGANPLCLRRMQVGDDPSVAKFAFDLNRMFLEGPAEAQSTDSEMLRLSGCSPSEKNTAVGDFELRNA